MALEKPKDLRPIIISGPSGVGKGTLVQKLFDTHPNTFASTVSHTTLQPRPNEVEGISYFYVSPQEFASLISQNAFLEHTNFSGHFYGTSKETIADQTAKGLVVILDIDMQGVKQIKFSTSLDARYVFIKPPSLDQLEARLRNRGTEKEEDIRKRLARAKVELEYADTSGVYDIVIVNVDLEMAYKELENFVYND